MIQFVEFNDPVCKKKFYKLEHLGPFCRFLQTGVLQTGPNSFQLMAMEVHGSSDENSENFITRLCKKPCRSHDDQRADRFLKQGISMTFQIGDAFE